MDTRDEIVYIADTLIRERGYNAFSFGSIGAMMDIRPAAVHYHFHSKTDLGNEVMTQERLRLTRFRRRFAGAPGEEQLKHLFTIFYHNSQTNCICLMGSLLPEFATFEDTMKESVKELCKEIVDWVTDCLEQAREAGRLSFDGAAADRALLVLSILLSSLLMSRVLGKKVFVRMADQLLQDLGADWRVADLPEESDRQKMPPFSYTDHS